MPLPSFKMPFLKPPAVSWDWKKILILLVEALMALVAVAALLVALFVGRLIYGPLTTTSLTPWVEQALSQPQYGLSAKVNQSTLHWDRDRRKIVLDLNGVQFLDPLEQKVADIPQMVAVLSPLAYFSETHSPWIVHVLSPQLRLRVDSHNDLKLGALQAGESNILEREDENTLTPQDLKEHLHDMVQSAQRTAFGLFSNLTVNDAQITLIDEPRNESWNFRIPELSIKRRGHDQDGMATVHITKGDKETDVALRLHYAASERLFHVGVAFKEIDPTMLSMQRLPFHVADYVSSHLSGDFDLAFNDDLGLHSGTAELELGEGQLNIPAYYPAPLKMKKAALEANYSEATKTLTLDPFTAELEKTTLSGHGSVRFEGDAHSVAAQVKLSNLRLEDLAMYWPEKVATNARVWILANMNKGLADEAVANVELSVPGEDIDNAKLDRVYGTVSLKDTELRYWEPLPKLEHVSATSTFDADHFDIDVKDGEMGNIKLKPSHVIISGLSADDQIATVEAHLEGPSGEVLKVLNRPPLQYADKMKVDPALVTGSMEGVLKTSFPLIKALLLEQMNISAEVNLKELGIKKIVDFLTISDGTVALSVDTHALSIDGEAKINTVPAHVHWDEKFTPAKDEPLSHGVAHATARAESAANFGVEFAAHSDPMPITVTYDRYPDLSRLGIVAEAKGARLDIPDIWYHKVAGAPASFQLGLEWGGGMPMRLSTINLSGSNLDVKGSGSFDASGKKLQKLTLNPFIVDKSHARIDFLRGNDGVPGWTVTGEAIDIEGLLSAPPEEKNVTAQVQNVGKQEPPSPLKLDIQVDRLITGEKSELGNTKIKGTRDAHGWSYLNVSSVAAEQTPFNLSIAPQGDIIVLQASTPNMGNVLRSLDVTDTLTGGKLQMDGKSTPGDVLRGLFGHIKLTDFRVSNMPFMVKLLSAISPDALLVMGSQTLHFDELNSEYIWNRDSFIFTKANTSTGSLGLTAAGKIDTENSRIDLEGQVIPVVFISKILGAIPVLGDLLTGGEGHGLFAATYQVKGALAKPAVSVNPVSVLAPGIIRDILFTNPNIAKEKK